MEMVDIVDENLNTIGSVPKDEAHKRGLLHVTVISEVIDSKGRWTLVKQASDKQDPGQYVSPVGGHVRTGESYDDALKREALEEMGLQDFAFKNVGKGIYNRFVNGHQENHYFVVYEIYSNSEPTLNEESVGFRRFTKEEIITLTKKDPELFGDAFHFVIKNIYGLLHQP